MRIKTAGFGASERGPLAPLWAQRALGRQWKHWCLGPNRGRLGEPAAALPARPCPHPTPGGAALPGPQKLPPRARPQAAQRALCLGWKQLLSPQWEHGLCLAIKLGGPDRRALQPEAKDHGAAPQPLTACQRPWPFPTKLTECCGSLGREGCGGRGGRVGLPLLAPRAGFTASRMLGVNVRGGTAC